METVQSNHKAEPVTTIPPVRPTGMPTNRSFGFVFTAVFAIVGLFPMISGQAPRPWALALAAIFLTVALIRPSLLTHLNRLWYRFGLLLHRLISPLILGAVFFGVIAPMGFAARALGRDLLRLKRQPNAATYWIRRDPPGPGPDSLKNQF